MRIYPEPVKSAIEREQHPLSPDPNCTRCLLHDGVKTVCMAPASYEEGALLVYAEKPGGEEDAKGEAQAGKSGTWLRENLARWWDGPVVYDNSVRCYPGDREPSATNIAACRPYLAWLLREVKPSRVLCLGAKAMLAVLGRSVAPMTTRRGYGWLGERNVPVFELMHPAFALRNRFVKEWFLHDLKWALTTAPPTLPPWNVEAYPVVSRLLAETCLADCRDHGGCSFDCEASGQMFEPEYRLLSVAVTPRGTDVAFTWDENVLAAGGEPVEVLKALLESESIPKDGHNLKYDVHAVQEGLGVTFRGYGRDTRLGRKLLEAEADGRLEVMQELVGMGGAKDESQEAIESVLAHRAPKVAEGQECLFGEAKKRASDDRMKYVFGEIPTGVLMRRNATDAISTRRLESLLWPMIEEDAAARGVWEKLYAPSTEALVEVERTGVKISIPALEAADDYFRMRQEEILPRLKAYGDFDADSPQQVSALLFEKLKLSVSRTTDAGHASVDKDSLEALKGKHPIVADILDWRWCGHQRGTYGCGSDGEGGLRQHIRSDGRVHPTFDPMGTRIGRLNCTDPNLQNITREEREDGNLDGKMIRDAFVAEDGWVLLEVDQSQIELRAMAYLSGDEVMKGIFQRGEDIHQRTAELISEIAWRIKPSEVRKPHRTKAKIFNFSLAFGKGDNTLAEELGISVSEAKRIHEAIYGKFTRMKEYKDACLAYARKKGEVWTRFDDQPARRRSLWRIADHDDGVRVTAEHGAFHTPVSGTAAHYCLRNLIECVRWLREDAVPARLGLMVHDSLLFEVREDCVPEVAWQVKRIMEQHSMGDVPLCADIKTGRSWGSLKKYAVAA